MNNENLVSTASLPPVTRTRSGVEFCPGDNVWQYREGVKTVCLRFDTLDVDETLRHEAKRVLMWYAENTSPSHLVNSFSRFKHFAARIKP
ncbi:MAG TPA: hypothetical protein VEG32_14900, partial [Clostridia bacterium]|nr:hypothetical protein [Clostridia bacterium]